ncbi:hypothetical protein GCM10027037_17070 [Mucilaginibacter koreensis]
MSDHSIEEIEKDIKNELQLERMILFSDAVFAIVITLMAIELRIPESEHKRTAEEWHHVIKHLFSVFVAYGVSFGFIGSTWYRHLKLFGFLKDYDTGLVVRNLILLFLIGLFPFSASVVTTPTETIFPFVVYAVVIILCMAAQYALQYYVIVQRPQLRNQRPIDKQLIMLKIGRLILAGLIIAFTLTAVSYIMLSTENKPLAFLWMAGFGFVVKFVRQKYKSQLKSLPPECL